VKATIFWNAACNALLFLIIPFISLLILTGCDTETTGIIDPPLNTPFIQSIEITPDVINTDTIFVNGQTDPDETIPVRWQFHTIIETRETDALSLRYRIKSAHSTAPLGEGTIEDIDTIDTEIIELSGYIDVSIARSVVGEVGITIYAETREGYRSNHYTKNVRLIRQNQPPEIVHVEAPDTIDTATIEDETIISFIVFTEDPDGADDVVRVESYNIQPNNNRVNLPNLTKVTDGEFRIDIPFPSDAIRGTHRFHFTAFDRLGEASEQYVHNLLVK